MNTRINQQQSLQYLASRSLSETSATAKSANSSTASAATAGSDKLSLSSQAGQLSQLSQLVANTADINSSKVQSLKASIANGEYQINPQNLAHRMLGAETNLRSAATS